MGRTASQPGRAEVFQGFFPSGFPSPARFAPQQPRPVGSVPPQNARPTVQPAARPQAAGPAEPRVQRLGSMVAMRLPDPWGAAALGAGQRLPDSVQRKLESVLSSDLSDVRVFVTPKVADLGAVALARGSNVYFAPGQYNPTMPRGQQILAHEVAHVVQQRQGRVRNPFGAGVAVVHDPLLEVEADRIAQVAFQRPDFASPVQARLAPSAARHPSASLLQAAPSRVLPVASQARHIATAQAALQRHFATLPSHTLKTLQMRPSPFGPGGAVVQPIDWQWWKSKAHNTLTILQSGASIASGIASAAGAVGMAEAIPALLAAIPGAINYLYEELAREDLAYTDTQKDRFVVRLTRVATNVVSMVLPPILAVVGVTSVWPGVIATLLATVTWVAASTFTDKYDTWEKQLYNAIVKKCGCMGITCRTSEEYASLV